MPPLPVQTDPSDTSPSPQQPPPSDFQRRVLWIAITAVSILAIGAVAVYFIHVVTEVLQFLQPVLVPIAFAGILAYLLEPIIKKLTDRGTPRFRAMIWVYGGFHALLVLLFLSVAVPTFTSIRQQQASIAQHITVFVKTALDGVDKAISTIRGESRKPVVKKPEETGAVQEAVPPPETHTVKDHETIAKIAARYHVTPEELERKNVGVKVETGVILRLPDNAKTPGSDASIAERDSWVRAKINAWVTDNSEEITARVTGGLTRSFQGIMGLFGYLVGFLLVPVYLYYFLKESSAIQKGWSDYLPLRASQFRTELVSCLTEINGYLIAFFRGQMLVSMIDGLLVGICLAVIGLPYSMLIGVFVAMLGLIPYVGNLLCLLAASAISVAHFSNPSNMLWGITSVWVYPLIVIGIFTVVQQINSLVTAPKIVGDAVGLHPLTVIFSVLFWSLLIGGLLGALLAVPLTASVKVILRRYVWERRVQPQLAPPQGAPVA